MMVKIEIYILFISLIFN